MTTDPKPMCKERVAGVGGWRFHDCGKPAVTAAGFCRLHDPELRKERAKKRGPTKWEREAAAWSALDKAIEEVRALGHDDLATRIRNLAFAVRFP